MTQKTSPFLEAKYGWDYGESGWNIGADENWLKFSYLFDGNIDGIVDNLPLPAVPATAYYLNTDKRIYFAVDGTYYSTPLPKWFQFKLRSDGTTYLFNGTSVNTILSPANLQTQLDGKQPLITPGTTLQYFRGDKTFQTLNKAAVGLSNVDNTSDINKPTSTETQAKIDSLTNALNSTLKIAIIGDSLSQPGIRNEGWASQLGNIIEELTGTPTQIRNVAIAASTWDTAANTNQHEAGTKNQIQEVISFSPDLIFIALGINDAIYVGGYTSTQVIANAQAMINSLRLGAPYAKIIYCEEFPHDPALGTVPSSLNNQSTIPFSHKPLTLLGLTNVRINSADYLNATLTPSALAAHQLWGTVTNSVRTMVDGYFSANLWKMARMGCIIDGLHVDELGHTFWAWQAVTYLATTTLTNTKVNFSRLNISTLGSTACNIDQAYSAALAKTLTGNVPGQYRGYSNFERISNWMLRSPSARMQVESTLRSSSSLLPVSIVRAWPGSSVFVAADTVPFVDTGRKILADGSHTQTLIPNNNPSVFSSFATNGSHILYYAVTNPDGSVDAFSQEITVQTDLFALGASALRYLASDVNIPLNATSYLPIAALDHDDIGVGTSSTAFTIPAGLAGRKVRLRAGVRSTIPLSTADTTASLICGIQKNRLSSAGNSVLAGRGLPSETRNLVSNGTTDMITDVSMQSAAITVASGDTFEVFALITKTSTGAATLKAVTFTWFEIEVVN